jgi:hypothetical protein
MNSLKMESSLLKHTVEDSDDSRSSFRRTPGGSESPCKNCDHSSDDDQTVEGPALPPQDSFNDHRGDNNAGIVKHLEGPSTPPLSKSPSHAHYSSNSHSRTSRKLD